MKDMNTENNGEPTPKKPDPSKDLLIGAGISVLTYVVIWVLSIIKLPMTVMALMDGAILVAFGFLVVKFFRTNHTNAAVIMLVFISPGLLVLLLFGSCSLLLMGI